MISERIRAGQVNRFVPSPSLSATHADSMLDLPSELGSEPSELWRRLSLVVIGVVSATLKGAGLCGPAQKARQCVDGFVRTGLQQVILPTAPGVSNEGGSSPLLVPLPAVS